MELVDQIFDEVWDSCALHHPQDVGYDQEELALVMCACTAHIVAELRKKDRSIGRHSCQGKHT